MHPIFLIDLKFVTRDKQHNREVNTFVGAEFKFDCRVTGFPEPNITWIKDDQHIEERSYRFAGISYNGI